jgi:predicted kinase
MTESPSPLQAGESKQAQIVRLIRASIEAGQLRDGEALPSTRVLAAQWDVSVYTVSGAMQTLSEQGLVVNVSRSKRVVRNPNPTKTQTMSRNSPVVIFVGGWAGSGKTEFGRILARRTGWPILDKDTTTRPVVELALEVLGRPGHDRESKDYAERIRPREYEALIGTAAENVECGVSAIVTAPFIREFTDPAWLDRTNAAFIGRGARPIFAWIRCDTETMHMYVRGRGAARDAGKLADWETYSAGIDTNFRPAIPHVLIDNSGSARPLQEQADHLVEQLERGE